ncbi:MAG: heat-inducible transcription repressor HrcA [Gemmatimonadales bacterium]|nr:heat-inducible transcription repressor HrcA [Gemmatimonadales bacterium]
MTWQHGSDNLTERERQVLEAIIETYVETAEPAGSRTIAKRFDLGVSAATIRNTMSDLEERGYLYHPHTSAGRVPTDHAYRVYVDSLMAPAPPTPREHAALRHELGSGGSGIESILRKAADVLGVLTKELGVAIAPTFDNAVLERLELLRASTDRILMVLVLRGGSARTLFVEVQDALPSEALASVAHVLNERLSGLTLREIRASLRDRLRDASGESTARELLNIFIEEADQLFEVGPSQGQVVLGSAQLLAGQPEFHSSQRIRTLLELTERRDVLRLALEARPSPGISVTIGGENLDPTLAEFTIVTSTYRSGPFAGMIGVIGPTRMPYQKVVALVEHTSRMLGDLIK